MKTKFFLLFLGAGFVLIPFTSAQAQPDLNEAPKGQNPRNWGNNRILLNRQPLTPEQLKQMQVLARERKVLSIRQQLGQGGCADMAVQDAIIAFFKDKEAARDKLQTQWQALSAANRQPTITDVQLAAQLNDFQAAADQEKDRRAKASKELSAKIGLDQKPRLQLLLITMGLVDDDTALLQGSNSGGLTTLMPRIGGLFDLNKGQDLDLRRYIPLEGGVLENGAFDDALGARVQTPVGPIHLDFGVGHD